MKKYLIAPNSELFLGFKKMLVYKIPDNKNFTYPPSSSPHKFFPHVFGVILLLLNFIET